MSPNSNVEELLEKGIYHYGLGEVEKAIELWYQVLERDPGNETAREYIEIETGTKVDSGAVSEAPSQVPSPAEEEIIEPDAELAEKPEAVGPPLTENFLDGQKYMYNGRWAEAVKSFEAAHKERPSNPYYWSHLELARANLIKEVIEELGGKSATPYLTVPLNRLVGQKSFTQEEGFVLSLITGDMSLEDVISLSPLPRFQAYSIMHRLMKEDLLKSRRTS